MRRVARGDSIESEEENEGEETFPYAQWVCELDEDIEFTRDLLKRTENRIKEINEGSDNGFYQTLLAYCEGIVTTCKTCLSYFKRERQRYQGFANEQRPIINIGGKRGIQKINK